MRRRRWSSARPKGELRPAHCRHAFVRATADGVQIYRSDARTFGDHDWRNSSARTIAFLLTHAIADISLFMLNSAENGVSFQVQAAPHHEWELAPTSDPDQRMTALVSTVIVRGTSFTLLRSRS